MIATQKNHRNRTFLPSDRPWPWWHTTLQGFELPKIRLWQNTCGKPWILRRLQVSKVMREKTRWYVTFKTGTVKLVAGSWSTLKRKHDHQHCEPNKPFFPATNGEGERFYCFSIWGLASKFIPPKRNSLNLRNPHTPPRAHATLVEKKGES